MKAVRISLLTMTLLVGATVHPVPTADRTSPGDTQAATTGRAECYLVNGMWVCDS
jgi:hypothetical protein